MRPISELKDTCKGADIYIIGSGPSMDFFDPEFFRGRIVLGVNEVYCKFPVTYIVGKHIESIAAAAAHGIPAIMSKHHCGDTGYKLNESELDFYMFEHACNGNYELNYQNIGQGDKIFVSESTLSSAMHVAAYMGAANIILCGHDCGLLDNKQNFDGYMDFIRPIAEDAKYSEAQRVEFYNGFLARIESHTITLREKLKAAYGCRVYSLNPFVNIGLEGHVYQKTHDA
jgi:hypothetical protein